MSFKQGRSLHKSAEVGYRNFLTLYMQVSIRRCVSHLPPHPITPDTMTRDTINKIGVFNTPPIFEDTAQTGAMEFPVSY